MVSVLVLSDGQVVLSHDLLGFYERQPPFVKIYTNLNKTITKAFKLFRDDVRSSKYPGEKHSVHMDKKKRKS